MTGSTGAPEVRPRIFLPHTVSEGKKRSLEEAGADLVLHGTDCIQAETAARKAADDGGLEYISPYNDVQVRIFAFFLAWPSNPGDQGLHCKLINHTASEALRCLLAPPRVRLGHAG